AGPVQSSQSSPPSPAPAQACQTLKRQTSLIAPAPCRHPSAGCQPPEPGSAAANPPAEILRWKRNSVSHPAPAALPWSSQCQDIWQRSPTAGGSCLPTHAGQIWAEHFLCRYKPAASPWRNLERNLLLRHGPWYSSLLQENLARPSCTCGPC